MSNDNFLNLCKNLIVEYYHNKLDKNIENGDVFVVWNCKTLQNHKAIVATKAEDHLLFEMTFNGDKKELYFDAYDKKENQCIKVEEE